MSTNAQLSRDLDAAISDGETLAKTQLSVAITYLARGLSFEASEIEALIKTLIEDIAPERPKLRVVAGTRHQVTQ